MSGQIFHSQGNDGVKSALTVDVSTGECEMLRALYDFKATIDQTLDFSRNDHFILHSSSNKQRNWWHVINCEGRVGYIPSNYVETVQVSSKFLAGFINKCIAIIQKELSSTESGGGKRQQLLKELTERKKRVEAGMRSPIPPRPPTRGPSSSPNTSPCDYVATPTKTLRKSATAQSISTSLKQPVRNSLSDTTNCGGDHYLLKEEEQPALVVANSISVQQFKDSVDSNEVGCGAITEADAYRLVHQVRRHTELDYELSRVAVGVVVSTLIELLPCLASDPLNGLMDIIKGEMNAEDELLDETHDAQRLSVVLSELVSCKEDAQQRSWELYEDESTILEYLKELTSIIKHADPAISRRVLSREKYCEVEGLLEYYQMEVRWSIRKQLIEAFSSMCKLHSTFIKLFLNSVLPMELARDMQSNVKDVAKQINSAKLLTVIFSMGDPMPITHLEQLGEEFVGFLLALIEEPPEANEQISEEFFTAVVAYNLQFMPQSQSNIVVEALSNHCTATNFTEKLLFNLNREEDPVRLRTPQNKHTNSLLKLIVDIFFSSKAANLFYTNDINVLIDIIVRQLTDLSPGDERRTLYLQLCRLVLRNTNYAENQHRCSDLHKCFTRIFCEETAASQKDQALVREISNEFPQYFK